MARARVRAVVRDGDGDVQSGTSIYVYSAHTFTPALGAAFVDASKGTYGTLYPATLYTTVSGVGTYPTQPITTNALGIVIFYTSRSLSVDLVAVSGGVVTAIVPADPAIPDIIAKETWLNVDSFDGVDKTGATSTGAAINSTVWGALPSGGGTVYFPDGIYLLEVALAPTLANTTICGSGTGATTLKQAQISTRGISAPNVAHITIRDLTVDGQRNGDTGGPAESGVEFTRGTYALIENVHIKECAGTGLAFAGSEHFVARNVKVTSGGYAGIWCGFHTTNVSANYARHGLIEGCTVDNVYADGFSTHRYNRFVGCRLNEGGIGYPADFGGQGAGAFYTQPAADAVAVPAHHNVFDGCISIGNTASGFDLSPGAHNNTIVGCNSSFNRQGGINCAGSHNTIVGNTFYGNGYVFTTDPTNVLIDGIILGSPGGSAECHSNTVVGNTCNANYRYGIALHNSTGGTGYTTCPVNNVVTGNNVRSNNVSLAAIDGGIYVSDSTINNRIFGNEESAVDGDLWRLPNAKIMLGSALLPTKRLDILDTGIRVRTTSTKASSAAAGDVGEWAWDDTYFYVRMSTGWRRIALGAAF